MPGPNEDDPIFFKQIGDYLIDFVCENIIASGDFNLVQDVNLDKQGGRDLQTHKKALQELDTIKLNLDLGDIWRDLNPDKKRLTWRRRNPTIQCRLDFFLISNGLYSKVASADITPGYKTDYSMITLGLTIQSNPKGPGLWKLNTSFLSEIEYVNKVKLIINETTQQYKDDNEVDDSLLWEMIRHKIRELSIKYGSYKKNNRRQSKCY